MGDKMKENNELLILIHDNVKMGLSSTKKLLSLIKEKDNKIKFLLEEQLQKYEKFYKKCKNLLKKEKVEIEHSTFLKELTGAQAMKMEVKKDNSDAKIADILTRGFSMGNINIEAKIHDYKKEAKHNVLSLAKDILAFGEDQIKLLKAYL